MRVMVVGSMYIFTGGSLCATSTTRLYAAGTEEQLIMERTGHRSIEGVHSYNVHQSSRSSVCQTPSACPKGQKQHLLLQWFVRNPGIPAALHMDEMILESVLCPSGSFQNHSVSGFFRHWR